MARPPVAVVTPAAAPPAAAPAVVVTTPARDYTDKTHLKVFHYLSYLVPFFLLLGGYAIPAMELNVFAPVPGEYLVQLLGGALVLTVLALLWIIMDFFVVSNHRTPVTRLRENATISILIALILVGLSCALFAVGALGWWLVVPTIAAVVDALISVDRGMENAAQKPITQVESTRP